MLRLKVITYTQDLINKSTIDSIVLLTKDGKQMSILTGSEYGNVQEHVALYDASLKTFIVEDAVIGGTAEYEEAKMLELFDGASILYADVSYNGDSLFADEIWIREISLRNDERYVSIDRTIPRNFWHFAFGPFKEQQRYEHRDFDACLRKAMEDYQYHDLEADPTEFDTDDMVRIARAIAHDVWDRHDKMFEEERKRNCSIARRYVHSRRALKRSRELGRPLTEDERVEFEQGGDE